MIVPCRAKIVDDCYDGREFTDDDDPRSRPMDDGTWDGETIVCDACYVALMPFTPSGAAKYHDLEKAIEVYLNNRDYLREPDTDVEAALAEAEAEVRRAELASSRWRSAMACVQLARAEIARRAAS